MKPKKTTKKLRPAAKTSSVPFDEQGFKFLKAQTKGRGLYQKYLVHRTDGSDAKGGKHHGCSYFVLDLCCDPHARAAIKAYADSCKADYPKLAADLYAIWDAKNLR
jgi:hypothetical protein